MALFQWSHKPWGGAEIGDRRRVTKFIWWPKLLGGEWRWLGWECVIQEHMRWHDYMIGGPHRIGVRGWRDVEWVPKTGKGRS